MLAALLAAAIATQPSAVEAVAPRSAPSVYVTPNHFLTFRLPAGLYYCPLPDSWTGSDHGTVLFLRPPARCGGAGFPSSSREFSPDDTPRIEIYYGYAFDEDEGPPEKCVRVARIRIMGRSRLLCDLKMEGMKAASVSLKYQADSSSEVILSLISRSDRFAADLVQLRAVAASIKPCKALWTINGKTVSDGWGEPCPIGKWF